MSSNNSRYNFKCTRHGEMILEIFEMNLHCKKMCDVVIIADIDGTKISAHRILLEACSLYFFDLFLNASSEVKEVHLDGVSGSAVKALVEYCYTGVIEIRKDNVDELLTAAWRLEMADVSDACQDFLAGDFRPSNDLLVAQIVQNDNCKDIYETTMSFVNQNYMQLCKTDQFLQLDVQVVCKIIESDDLVVDSEECVFNSCVAWINFDRVRRGRYFHQLLALIRLPLLTFDFIDDHVWPLCESRESIKLYKQAEEWHKKPHTRTKSKLTRRPRKSRDTVTQEFSVQIPEESPEETGPQKVSVQTPGESSENTGTHKLSVEPQTQSSQQPKGDRKKKFDIGDIFCWMGGAVGGAISVASAIFLLVMK